jgi:hypothetical protein
MQCLLCGGSLRKRGASSERTGVDVYFCTSCPNVYQLTRGYETEALERRARETGLAACEMSARERKIREVRPVAA